MAGADLREKLRNGDIIYGTMLFIARNPRWAGVLAGLGFDYIIIDTEHAAYSRGEVADVIAALDPTGLTPMVRIPSPSPHQVTMALDAGAHGVLVPYCETVAEVRAVVGAAHWRPLKGTLLQHAIDTGDLPSSAAREYLQRVNRNNFVMIGIESVPAIDNLEAIVQVEGIDAIFVGPRDLTVSMGIPEQVDHPEYEAMLRRIIGICSVRNIPVAIHLNSVEAVTKWVKEGARFVLFMSDTQALAESFRRNLETIKSRMS
ncbi:MAG TPA: aldolase/citrate lyase family protein [Anaerolineae bacterium]